MDLRPLSFGCPSAPVTGYLQTSGIFVANPDGSYSDNTTTTGTATLPLSPACLTVSSVPVECSRVGNLFTAGGWSTGVCTDTDGQCNCTLTMNQQGGMGAVVPYTETTGAYSTSGNTLTATNVTYSYCAAGDTLSLTPQMSGLRGTIVLQREGTTGSGGAGTGGAGTGGAGTGGVGTGGVGTGGVGTGGVGTGGWGVGGDIVVGSGGDGVGGDIVVGSGGDGTGGFSTGGDAGYAGEGTGGAGTGGDGTGGDGTGGDEGTGGAQVVDDKPCDIYQTAGTPCVAAHSTVRALYASFDGNLYTVKRADGATQDIPVSSPGGYADISVQDSFCGGSSCTIFRVLDQTGNGNFLEAQTPDTILGTGDNAHPGHSGMTAANATAELLTVDGHQVYSLYTRPSQAYWNDGSQNGMPLGAEPQGIYMVTSGTHFNGGCCYDYGSGPLDRTYSGGPMMDTIYFGNCTIWGTGAGDGPWVMADMEDGMLSGADSGNNPSSLSLPFDFVTAMEKNDGTSNFALKGGNATDPNGLIDMYNDALPGSKSPMRKEGAVILGAGGDCCYSNNNASEGTFYEGAVVSGYPSDATDEAIHANIVEAGYGQ
jgi:hypothetical protein